jgi:diacylglycerol O-acyltransferase / wax synthase
MERMTGIDPMFIYSDTPETPMEVAYACVFDPSSLDDGYSFEHVRALLEARIPEMRPFRRRLMPVPLGLDHPRWVDDPEFDVSNHLHRAALPAPGGEAEFTQMVAAIMGRPLLSGQPPWEMHVIEGLSGGMIGLIAKVHHAVIDGVAGAQLFAQLLDLSPEGRAVTETCQPWVPPQLPTQTRLMSDALPDLLSSPLRLVRAAREAGRTAVRLARRAGGGAGSTPVSIPIGAPATFELPVTARRQIAFAALDMSQVREVRERFGVTINEVVLAICSGALRTHLLAHGDESDEPLVAVVPVSVRDTEAEAGGNQLSAMFVPLSNDLKTPLERLRTVRASSTACKRQELAVGYGPLASLLADAIPPALAKPVIQLGVRSGILRRLRPGNLMVSNVPGPDFPLYFAGLQLRAVYPLGPIVDGVSLNITVQSYIDTLYVGLNASAAAVPDLPGLARSLEDELTLLAKVAENTTSRHGVAGAGGRHRLVAPENDVQRATPRAATTGARPTAPRRPATSTSNGSTPNRTA